MSRKVAVRVERKKGTEALYADVDRTHDQEKVYNRIQNRQGCTTNGVEERTNQAQAMTRRRKQLFADREGRLQELRDRGDL